MKKSELRKVIKEEIKILNEGDRHYGLTDREGIQRFFSAVDALRTIKVAVEKGNEFDLDLFRDVVRGFDKVERLLYVRRDRDIDPDDEEKDSFHQDLRRQEQPDE